MTRPARARRRRALVAWSSGKDSAWALHELRRRDDVAVVGLLVTVNAAFGRVAMHGVRESLVRAQAQAAGLPLEVVRIPHPCSNAEYDAAMRAAMERARAAGVEAIAFGDLHLEDVRRYREERLAPTGIEPLFPLWGRDTAALAREMLDAGLGARVTCLDPRLVPASLAGREYDERLLAELPAAADPCGERGEFHTFAFAGPMFTRTIPHEVGESVEREGFLFTDLLEPSAS